MSFKLTKKIFLINKNKTEKRRYIEYEILRKKKWKPMKMLKTNIKNISFKTIENKISNQEDKYNIQ